MPSKTTPTATKTAAAKPRARKPIPDIDTSGTTSAVDALAGPTQTSGLTAGLQLIEVDPTTLAMRDQARTDATPDDGLIASVQRHGILQPPTVARDESDGRLYIVTGHRRVGAAIIAGLPTITVILSPRPATVDAALLEQQIVENERRAGLTAVDLARGYANLESLFGQTPEDIAAALGDKPERVRAGIKVARSQKVKAIMEDKPLDLEQAAIIAEFDGNAAAQKELADVAANRPQNFALTVEQHRTKVKAKALRAELEEQIKASGAQLAPTDNYGYIPYTVKPTPRNLTSITDPATGELFTEETHASCPGHAGFVYSNHPSTMVIRWVCLTPAEHPETKSAAEIEAEQKRDEERRAFEESRAAAIANQTARREWIKGLLAGKLDKLAGLHTYLASAFLTEDSSAEPRVTAQLLDIELPAGLPTWQQSDAATEAISEVVIAGRVPPLKLLLAAALAVHEEADDYYPRFTVAHYQHIEKWGYKLTDLDVERRDKAVRELAAQAESDAAEDATEEEVA